MILADRGKAPLERELVIARTLNASARWCSQLGRTRTAPRSGGVRRLEQRL